MKKILILLSVAAVLFACTKEKSTKEETPEFPDAPWATDPSLQVPIEFGTCNGLGIDTRAAITDLSGVQFGVLGVALGQGLNEREAVLLKNVVAQAGAVNGNGDNNVTFIDKTDGSTVKRYYYPLMTDGKPNYSFYAYHTTDTPVGGTNASVFDLEETTGTFFYKDVTLGATDILWASAVAPELVNPEEGNEVVPGFNAEYSRKAKVWYSSTYTNLYLPRFTFNHKTTAFHFYVQAADETSATSLQAGGVTLEALYLENIPTAARLQIVSGALEKRSEEALTAKLDAPGFDAPIVPSKDAVEVGTGFFILPTDEDITFNFTLKIPTGPEGELEDFTPATSFTLPKPASGEYKEGYSYSFRIIIKSLEQVIVVAKLTPWNTEDAFNNTNWNEEDGWSLDDDDKTPEITIG